MLALLGTPRLVGDDATDAVVRVTRPVALVAYLAAQGGWVPRAFVAGLFWPELDEREARTFARVLVHRARKLPWIAERLVVSGDRLRLDLPTDLAAFRSACARRDWPAALDAYGGPFLDGVALGDAPAFDTWLEMERADLAVAAVAAARALAESSGAAGDAATAADAWARLAALEPLDVSIAVRAVEAQLAAGRHAEARALARAHGERVRTELGTEPDPAVVAAAAAAPATAAATAADEGDPAVPGDVDPRIGDVGPAYVGVVVPSFGGLVGRDAELVALEAQLAGGARRLSVTGMGGVGKSRLVAELLARQQARFPDGAHRVALAEDADEGAVIAGVERAFGWQVGPEDRRARLVAALRDRDALVALDGLSDPAPAAALIDAAGRGAPGVRWLVASHGPLPLADAARVDLGGLAVDAPDGAAEGGDPAPAVRVVLDAARRASPGFRPTPDDLAAASRVARAVGGLPLALELAGAWGAAVGLAAAADACERGDPEFAEFAAADHDGRLRSVGAAVAAAWARLRPRQRSALAGLTAFAGDVPVDAAGPVAEASPALLVGLTHAALLRPVGAGRLAMHELVRRVAARHRPVDDVARHAGARHAHHFLGRLVDLAPGLVGADEAVTLARVAADLDDLGRAWTVACFEARDALSPAAVHAVGRVVELTDDVARFRGWFEDAWRAAAEEPFDDDVAAAVAVWLSHLRFASGEVDDVAQLIDRAEAATGLRSRALARWQRATVASAAGDDDAAMALLESARGDAERLGDADLLAGVLATTGNVVFFRDGDLDASDALLRRAHALHERTGSRRGLAVTSINLGAVASDRGDLVGARAWFERARDHARAIANRRLEGVAAGNLGHLAMMGGDADAAEGHLDAAIAARRAVGDAVGVAFARTKRATLKSQRGAVDAALLDLHEVVATLEAVGRVGPWVQALGSRARLLAKMGRLPEAEADARAGLERVVGEGAVEDALLALATAANVCAASGRVRPAVRAARAVLEHPVANAELRLTARAALEAADGGVGVDGAAPAGAVAAEGADAPAGADAPDLRAEARAALEALYRPVHAPAA